MTRIFTNVVADIDKELEGKFPANFDYFAMVQKVSHDAGVQVKTTHNGASNGISLHGLWIAMEQVHSLLTNALTVYGATTVPTHKPAPHVKIGKFMPQNPNESEYLIAKYLNKSKVETEDNHLNTVITGDQGAYDIQENDVQSPSVKPCVMNTQLHSVEPCVMNTQLHSAATPLTKNVEHTSIFAAHVDDIIRSANEVSDKEISEDTINNKVNKDIANYSDNSSIKKKRGRPKKTHFKVTSNQIKDLKTKSTFQLKFRKKYNRLKKKMHNDGSKLNCTRARGRPRKFPDGEPNEHFCRECDFVAKTRRSLSDHCHRIHIGRPTKCDVCHKIFPNRRYMKRHRSSHVEPQHCCDVCGKMYKIRKAMLEHKKTHEEGYARPSFPCDLCSKSFCSLYILTCHIKSQHLGQKRNYLCSVCGKSFTTKHSLQEHSNAHTGVKPHICEVCGKGFSYESALRDHKFVHVDNKQFVCEICSKAFSQRSGLKMHMRIHEQVKQFVCNDCGREFTQKQALQRHERVHKGDRPFICKLCSRNFSDASIIRRHLILVHKIHKDAKTWREDIISKVPGAINYHVERIPGSVEIPEAYTHVSMQMEVNTTEEKNEEPYLYPPRREPSAEGQSTSRPEADAAESIQVERSVCVSTSYSESRTIPTPPAMQNWFPGLHPEKRYEIPKPDFNPGISDDDVPPQSMDKTLVCLKGSSIDATALQSMDKALVYQKSSHIGETDPQSLVCRNELRTRSLQNDPPLDNCVEHMNGSHEIKAAHERLYAYRQLTDLQGRHPTPGASSDRDHPLPFPVEQENATGTMLETTAAGQTTANFSSHVAVEGNTDSYAEDVSHQRERTAQYVLESSGSAEGPSQYSSAAEAQSKASVTTSNNTVPASSQAWPMYAYYSHLASQFGMTLGDYPYIGGSSSSHQ